MSEEPVNNDSSSKHLFFGPSVGAATASSFAVGAGAANALNDGTAVVASLACIAAVAFLMSCYALWKVRQEEIGEEAAQRARASQSSHRTGPVKEDEGSVVVLHLAAMLVFAMIAGLVTAGIIQGTTSLAIFHGGNYNGYHPH